MPAAGPDFPSSSAALWLALCPILAAALAHPACLACLLGCTAGSTNPQAYIAACLQPLLGSPALNRHQAELLSGTLKASLPPQLLPDALAAACTSSAAGGGGGGGDGAMPGAAAVPAGAGWNEHTVSALQSILNAKPALMAAGVAQLAAAFQAAVTATSAPAGGAELAASVKFAKLVLCVVKQYPTEAAAARQQLQAAAAATRSFMSKPLLAAIAKL